MHRVLPDWRLLHAEQECLQVMRSGRVGRITRVLMAADGRLRYLQVQIAPMSGGVLLSLSDETDLHEDRNRLRHLAATDALTTLANRRLFDEQLRDQVEQARASGQPLVLVMADIDAFKAYNDRYGHSAGDDCLRQFALLFKAVFTRQSDLAARYGGEEFAVLLPGTGLEGATALVERLIELLHQRRLPHAASPVAGHVTASFGAAAFDPARDHDELSLLRRADSALYQAKQTGRDRLCVVSTDGTPTR
ncbi:MAG: GGDEF domain-containing protein [Sphaerotilus natans]